MALVVEDQVKSAKSKPWVVEEYTSWDGPTCPLSKSASMGRDEKQETHNHPGWWFLLKQRDFRPLRGRLVRLLPA